MLCKMLKIGSKIIKAAVNIGNTDVKIGVKTTVVW